MGGHPYAYTVPYQKNMQRALDALRTQEFAAGRYNPAMRFPHGFGRVLETPRGTQHASIDAARDAAMEEGTRSILDIEGIADEPDFCVAAPFSEEELLDLFGSVEPALDDVEKSNAHRKD